MCFKLEPFSPLRESNFSNFLKHLSVDVMWEPYPSKTMLKSKEYTVIEQRNDLKSTNKVKH